MEKFKQVDNKSFKVPKLLESEDVKELEKVKSKVFASPDNLRDIIDKLKKEIVAGEKAMNQFGGVSEQELIEKEDMIRATEIKIREMEESRKKLGEKKFKTILGQEKRIDEQLYFNNVDFISEVRNKIHSWNVADSKDYFSDEAQIEEAIRQCKEEKIKELEVEGGSVEELTITEAEPVLRSAEERVDNVENEEVQKEEKVEKEIKNNKKTKAGFWNKIFKNLGF